VCCDPIADLPPVPGDRPISAYLPTHGIYTTSAYRLEETLGQYLGATVPRLREIACHLMGGPPDHYDDVHSRIELMIVISDLRGG
jgi:hypothetical protein